MGHAAALLMGGGYTTWNPSDKTAGMVLSLANLKSAWSASEQSGVRAIRGMSSGKWYWECTPANLNTDCFIGMQKAAAAYYVGSDANGWGYRAFDGKPYNNGSGGSALSTYTSADVIGFAFDADAGKFYFRKNGTWQNSADPVAGTGAIFTGLTSGPYYAACSDSSAAADSGDITANFGASAFAAAAPTGFSGVYA